MPKPYKKKTRTKKAKSKANAGHVSARARELLATMEAALTQNQTQLAQSIARIAPTLVIKVRQYKAFINSVFTSYEYRRKNIPSVLLTMLTQINLVLEQVNHLLRLHNEAGFLQRELATNGYNDIVAFIGLTIGNMEHLEDNMQNYTQSALADYRGAQLGIETQPNMRNRTTRYTDAIVRPARTTRAQALTRRIRSI